VAVLGGLLAVIGGLPHENQPHKPCNFAPKRQGSLPTHAAPIEIGSLQSVPQTDFYVHRNIARCVSSYSIPFGLLPKALLRRRAGLFLRSRKPCFIPAVSV